MDSLRPSQREILFLTGALSLVSLVYEMTLGACFVMMTGDEVFWQSVTIGIYLAALGVGTILAGRRTARGMAAREEIELLFSVEVALAVVGALAVLGIYSLEAAYRFYYRFFRSVTAEASLAPFAAMLILCQGFTVAVGFLSGFEVPLLLELGRGAWLDDRRRLGAVLGFNYFGALGGSLLFSFALLPRISVLYAGAAAAVLNWMVCGYLLWRGMVKPSRVRLTALGAAGILVLAVGLASSPLDRFFLLNNYSAVLGVNRRIREDRSHLGRQPDFGHMLSRLMEEGESVRRWHSRYQTIDLVEDPDVPSELMAHYNERLKENKGFPHELTLFLDRRYQFYGAVEAAYHEHMAHVPVQLSSKVPRDVLILGGGDGLLARELLKYGDKIRTIQMVELDPKMIELARGEPRLRAMNEGSLEDPKVRVLIDDAYFYVRNCRRRFDAVYIDFPYPYNYSLARLYSVEFFKNVNRLLREGGVATLDYPLAGEDEETAMDKQDLVSNSIIMSTLKAAGFKTIVPYNTQSPEPVTLERAARLAYPLDRPGVPQDALRRRFAVERFRGRFGNYPFSGFGAEAAIIKNLSSGESFLTFSREALQLNFEFKDHGVKLYNLNARRLKVLEGVLFPYREGSFWINSIFRPRLAERVHLKDFAFDVN